MKVLLLTQFFSTSKGGGEYVFSIIAKTLTENNHKVWVITNKLKNEVYPTHKNLKIIFVPPDLEFAGGLPTGFVENLRYSINAIIQGRKIIKKEKIDLIHSNNFSPALSGSVLSFFTSKPHITTIHDVFSIGDNDFWKKWSKQNNVSKINALLTPYFEKFMKGLKYNCVHTVSDATKDDLKKLGIKKPIFVIPNAIEFSDIISRKTNPYQFIYVGRLVFYKNLEVVIKAIDIVRKKEPKIKLILVGDGPHRKSLVKLIAKLKLEKNVKFQGYVSSEEKLRFIGESNALVFPSLLEGFGLVILEAFSQKKPVIVSNLEPMSEIVSHGNNGFVLEPYDDKMWADYILKMVNNPVISQKMGKDGYNELKTKYNQEIMYEKLIKMYHNVLSKTIP